MYITFDKILHYDLVDVYRCISDNAGLAIKNIIIK